MRSISFGCKGSTDNVGVLVAQLGTPEAPTKKALRPYLKQFLSDPRVIEVNRYLWWVLLNGIILNTRPKRSAKAYARIWTDEGSPLLVTTKKQTERLQERIGSDVPVVFGMRYGNPSLESAIDTLIDVHGCRRIVLLPMYPQYAAPTTGSVYDAVLPHLLKRRWVPSLRVVEPYYEHPLYIKAIANSVRRSLGDLPEKPETLIFSYHGVPQRYVKAGDPYCCHCTETTRVLKRELKDLDIPIQQTFQSQFGREPWLQPYADKTFEKLAEEGVKRMAVACPGFVADCLETVDEIGEEGKEAFIHGGGETFTYIPCLNDDATFIECLESVVTEAGGDWFKGTKQTTSIVCPCGLGPCQKECHEGEQNE